jgi:hypothetical protein
MKMAKASAADLDMAMTMCNALEALAGAWGATVPEGCERVADGDESERLDLGNAEQCERILRYLQDLTRSASLMRVVYGCAVMLDPRNQCVDPQADTIEHHPDTLAGQAAKVARPLEDWHEDMGAVLWWRFPVAEAPWCGMPNTDDWPHYHTHWTPLVVPAAPSTVDLLDTVRGEREPR